MNDMQAAVAAQQVMAQKMQGLGQVETQVDQMMNKMDNLSSTDIATIRKNRVKEMKMRQELMSTWRSNGHGRYLEVADEKEWFEVTKRSKHTVCHFYRASTWRCEIVDKHLEKLAPLHMETKFLKINAEKCNFLVDRLKIVIMPTIGTTVDGKTGDMIEGFDKLGGNDKFSTKTLEKKLGEMGVLDYTAGYAAEEAARRKGKTSNGTKENKHGAAIYESKHNKNYDTVDFSDDDDADFWNEE